MFELILETEDAKQYFLKVLPTRQLSHSYIFEGPYGIGKKTFAMELVKTLLCSTEGTEPCNACNSCHMLKHESHPDLITIKKDKKTTKIDDVRAAINELNTKPYQSSYKILIVQEAHTLTQEAQNALLKTIEEPPSYAIIILVCENIEKLLPTIKSRCINIRFHPLSAQVISNFLSYKDVSLLEQQIIGKLCEGSMGLANDLLDNEDLLDIRKMSIDNILTLQSTEDIMTVYNMVTQITELKEDITSYLNFWLFWYRDIICIKGNEVNDLYFADYLNELKEMAEKLSFRQIGNHLDYLKQAIPDVLSNVNNTFIIEQLLLNIRNCS